MSIALLQQKLQTAIDENRRLADERDSLKGQVEALELLLEDIAFSSQGDAARVALNALERRRPDVLRVRKRGA